MHLAAAELFQLVEGGFGVCVAGGADRQSDKRLIGVEAGVAAAEVVDLKILDGLDDLGGHKQHLVVDAAEMLQSIEQQRRYRAQQV